MVVAMKNKARFVTIAGILLIAALALLPFWIRGRRMENRYKADRELFQTTAEAFCDKSIEIDWPVLVRSDDGKGAISKEYGFSESVINDIDRIFLTSNCCLIYAGGARPLSRIASFPMEELIRGQVSSIFQMRNKQ